MIDEKKRLEEEVTERAEAQAAEQVRELHEQLTELTKQLKTAQENELELRKQRRELERKQKEAELELARKVDEQTAKIKEELVKEYSLKEYQQEEQIAGLRRQIEELKRRAEQGSQQAKGEALENKLEDILRENFPDDTIEPVPKGIKGADVIQKVNEKSGQCCGTIIWESKNTKNWNDSWIEKLKNNQRDIRAEIAVLASSALPEHIQSFGVVEDVWVTHWLFASQLACALRINLIQLSQSKIAYEGRDQKMQMLYDYLTSVQFKQRVETIAGAFNRMSEDLAQERQAMERIWNKREKQIGMVMKGTAGMYGDIQGIVGAYLPEIEMLQLPYQLEAGDSSEL